MKRKHLPPVLAAIVAVALSLPASAADFPFDSFRPKRLADLDKDIQAQASALPAGAPVTAVDTAVERVRVRVQYTGESRPVPAEKAKFMSGAAFSLHFDPKQLKAYEQEYRFVEDGRSYWLPVQSPVAAFFAKEVKPGDTVDLFARGLGGYGSRAKMEAVLLVEEFQTPDN